MLHITSAVNPLCLPAGISERQRSSEPTTPTWCSRAPAPRGRIKHSDAAPNVSDSQHKGGSVELGGSFALVRWWLPHPQTLLEWGQRIRRASRRSISSEITPRHPPGAFGTGAACTQPITQHLRMDTLQEPPSACPWRTGHTGHQSQPAHDSAMLPTQTALFCFRSSSHLLYASNF